MSKLNETPMTEYECQTGAYYAVVQDAHREATRVRSAYARIFEELERVQTLNSLSPEDRAVETNRIGFRVATMRHEAEQAVGRIAGYIEVSAYLGRLMGGQLDDDITYFQMGVREFLDEVERYEQKVTKKLAGYQGVLPEVAFNPQMATQGVVALH